MNDPGSGPPIIIPHGTMNLREIENMIALRLRRRRTPWAPFFAGLLGVFCALARPPTRDDAAALPTRPEDWERPREHASAWNASVRLRFPRDEAVFRGGTPLVFAAGLSRTGTSTIQAALMELNLTVDHSLETMAHDLDFWYYYLSGQVERPDVTKLIEPRGVDAVADCWFAHLLPELIREYPDAKVILGTRPREPWLKSYRSYIATSHLYHWRRQVFRLFAARATRHLGLGALFRKLGWIDASGSGYDLEKLPLLMDIWSLVDLAVYGNTSPDHLWYGAMERHNNNVRALVPPENLLEFDNKRHSWVDILDFLRVEEPHYSRLAGQPLPWLNCVPGKTCVSHISHKITAPHEKLVFAACLALTAALAFLYRAAHAKAAA
ncbi:hypothetical protein AURANDRAFT_61955 [Aureococcus anophagefferens]|uniref:Sulfotransferase domain-containing protein n=1 Tax=Aureococcus anophagefferens TaxID=44056 RepID=F0Y1U4_AURAN|nr:hypothetical protein AURANDRAFT_61955 [Aureococcus anophagefferens]EGB10580.1 hypothetical protein AURANDRAFT_61955 [Aureococcus anophagefferens]|eukprot:XP_009034190.1 hypothetical protein AURANDRAFT_61955 [Aureococcus anophagefferens]